MPAGRKQLLVILQIKLNLTIAGILLVSASDAGVAIDNYLTDQALVKLLNMLFDGIRFTADARLTGGAL